MFRKNPKTTIFIVTILTIFCIPSCIEDTENIVTLEKKCKSTSRHISILFDGTENDPENNSNVHRLFQNTNTETTQALYIEGVDGLLGGSFGLGISKRIEIGYYYLSKNYNKQKEINLFGFSRGAYTARALAGLINTIGIIDFQSKQDTTQLKELVKELVKTYKNDRTFESKKINLLKKYEEFRKIKGFANLGRNTNVQINILGLFDTVEATWGKESFVLNKDINTCCPKLVFQDQVCNVTYGFHALSLDDTRAELFTPLLLNCDCTTMNCSNKFKILEEVWFSGSHTQVGGGNTLSSNAYNWMEQNILSRSNIILPKNYEKSISDRIQNTELETFTGRRPLVKDVKRPLDKFIGTLPMKKISLHKSAADRINKHPNSTLNKWYESPYFEKCYDNTNKKLVDCDLIEIVY